MMKRLFSTILGMFTAVAVLLPTMAMAAGGGKVANVVIVADPRKVHGVLAWWANLYNESHIYFALLTIIIIPLIGVIFGLVADWVMSSMGIDLKSRELAEH
ncbi:MAG: DVU0150 family protein [Thermodesulforhabdaceae bacterium]